MKFEIWLQIPKNEILNENFIDLKEQENVWNSLLDSFCTIIEKAIGEKQDITIVSSTNKPFSRDAVTWDFHGK